MGGKGATAEVSGQCLLSGCWVGREDLPDCHKNFFVKRYHWLFGEAPFSRGQIFRIFHEPLGKAVHFFIIPRRWGRKTPDKKETV